MKKVFILTILSLFSAFLLTGCAELGIPDPFAARDVNDVYFGQFTDIPIPADLSLDSKRTLVSTGYDGTRMGLETYEGRVDLASLSNAMIHNMAKQGWSLRGSISGNKLLQVHEKDQRYAVLYFYGQTMNTAMEIWILNRLADGLQPIQNMGNLPPLDSYSSQPSQTVDQWGTSTPSTFSSDSLVQ